MKICFDGHESADPSKNFIKRMIGSTQFAAFIMHEMEWVWHWEEVGVAARMQRTLQ